MYSRLCFFSYFTFTLTSNASGLNAQTRNTLEELIKAPEQYRYLIDLTNIPTASEKNLEKIASGDFIGGNSYFDQMLQEQENEIENRVNSYFSGIGRYNSSAHKNELQKNLSDVRARAMSDRYDRNLQYRMQARTQIEQSRQNRLRTREHLLQSYNDALFKSGQAAAILEADNQRPVDAQRTEWVKEDNRAWKELQDKADMLHKAAAVDSALQGQNKALANAIREEIKKALNDDRQSYLSGERVKNTTSSTLETTPNTSSKAHVNLPLKIETTSQTAGDTEKPSKLADNNKTVALSHAPLNSEKKPKCSRHKWQALW
ncbi:hypothetical protein NPX99_06475 [Bartonella sp. 220]|uniref:hypothetical protein n=1 Tax=Bartonella sp. 220B TaxID=2967260 RepID=UPI0022A9F001|nr:hypothetical protein [Bartonella sp. 220B]MCZ2158912.1 hypothetical protein [Bartonella sp. 220B]